MEWLLADTTVPPATFWGVLITAMTIVGGAVSKLWHEMHKSIHDQKKATAEMLRQSRADRAAAISAASVERGLMMSKLDECEQKHTTAQADYVAVLVELTAVKERVQAIDSLQPQIIELAQGVHRLIDKHLGG